MNGKLFLSALTKYLCGVVLVGALLFWPAGTWAFRNGWLLMGVLFIPIFIAGLVMMVKNPALLKSRLDAKEKQSEQKAVLGVSALLFIAGFVLAGFTHRFGWYTLPDWVVYTAAAVFLLAYGMYAEVLRENTYLSRTIGVQEGQQVVSTGLYGVVRHPMYLATVLLFWAIPLVLGSLISFLLFLPFPLVLAVRIRHEERLLEQELEGYREYQQKVQYRLIPFIW